MKKALRWLAVLTALPVLCLLAILLINAFDDKLNEKAAFAGESRTVSVPDAQNGYLAVLAMAAGDGANPAAYAQAWLAEARAAGREQRAEKPQEAKRSKRPMLCDAAQVSCLAEVQDKAAEIKAQLDAYREDLDRYEKLIAFRAYEEVLDYPMRLDARLPSYQYVGAAQRAYLLRAALKLQEDKIDEALTDIERDMAFHRAMLAGTRTLIGKMVAAANLMRDLAFLADFLQTSTSDLKPFAARLESMLQPIAPAVLRLEQALEAEYAMIKPALKNPRASDGIGQGGLLEAIGMRYFYKPNATINAAYANFLKSVERVNLPPAALMQEHQNRVSRQHELKFWDYVDNPVGNILLRVGAPSYTQYALRLHDLDAYNRLLGLGAAIIAGDVPTESVAQFVARSDARFLDPYTGKPMLWDEKRRQLSFGASDVLAKRKFFNMEDGRVRLHM